MSIRGGEHYSPYLLSGTLPHCEDKNGERSMVAGTGLGRQFLHSTGRQ